MTLSLELSKAIIDGAIKHRKPDHVSYKYGTAGFRMNATLLDPVMYAVGILAALRSKQLKGKTVGVMITASHNAAEDNGVKLVEPLGEMLLVSWESHATRLANAESGQVLVDVVLEIIQQENIQLSYPANVVIGRDTRPSGETLLAAVKDGVLALGGTLNDQGFMTTPILHYLTRSLNTVGTPDEYGQPSHEGYYKKLADAFCQCMGDRSANSPLYLDAANGIGAIALKRFLTYIPDHILPIILLNDDINDASKLNKDCGADHVKLYQKAPSGLSLLPNARYASFDGDADRIVYYYSKLDGMFALLDGDKIATLAASYIQELVSQAHLTIKNDSGKDEPVHVGLVQTAYANGSSTKYVKEKLKVPVVFTQTGVKHLHHAAEHFDIGVYFEANGHGTVLFSKRLLNALKHFEGKSDQQKEYMRKLAALANLINQTVGDALSDMLMVEVILAQQSTDLPQWDSTYTDLPSRQEKVKVANRHIFLPINADTELEQPEGLQVKINVEVAKFKNGRSFVRPSGTEDIVRVYAEADTKEETELLTNTICGIVFDGYGGVGIRPAHFK